MGESDRFIYPVPWADPRQLANWAQGEASRSGVAQLHLL